MGFLERLRESFEISRRLAEEARARQVAQAAADKADKAAVEDERRQQEDAAKEFHRLRRESARAFREESGIGRLTEELAGILIERADKNPLIIQVSYESKLQEIAPPGLKRAGHVEEGCNDQDNYIDYVFWDRVVLGRKSESFSSGGAISYNELLEKGLTFETCHDGDILLHTASQLLRIPREQWIDNPSFLEEAMGKAYNKPFTRTTRYAEEVYHPLPSYPGGGH